MFQPGDYVVCPGHGVGQLVAVEERDFGGEQRQVFVIRIISNNMKIMIPKDGNEPIRSLVSLDEVSGVYDLLQDHDVEVDTSTWNRRHRDYMTKVKTGSLTEIAEVLRALLLLKSSKKLSFGERKMLDQCKDLIVKEIALSTGGNETEIDGKIEGFFRG